MADWYATIEVRISADDFDSATELAGEIALDLSDRVDVVDATVSDVSDQRGE